VRRGGSAGPTAFAPLGLLQMLTTALDGSLFLERYGQTQPTVLALHGWGRDRRDWHDLLGSRDDAAAVDLPGFGLSPAPGAVWGAAEYADFVLSAFPDLQGLVVLGHSFGGRVAIEMAVQRPDVVRALVLTGVPLLRLRPGGRPKLSFRVARTMNRHGLLSDAHMDRLRQKHGSADYRNADGVMRDILVKVVNEDYRDQLRLARQPVWLVWGGADTSVPLEVARAAAAELADARVRISPHSGHLLDADLNDLLAGALSEAADHG
jgi:pimeloyl-ACP methyl ester carboxylesterase